MAGAGKKTIKDYVVAATQEALSSVDPSVKKYQSIITSLEKHKLKVRKQFSKDYDQLNQKEALAAAYRFGEITREELKQSAEEAGISLSEIFDSKAKATAVEVGQAISKITSSKMMTALQDGVTNYLGMYDEYVSNIATRLIGLNTNTRYSYNEILDRIEGGVGISRYTTVYNVLTELNKYVSQGILNNIEQRAFLSSVSDRIATTFDAFDSSLLTLIKLNREDSTQAYLGMEAALTEFLNTAYMDSSYMSSSLNSSVSSAIMESVALLGTQMGAEFQFQVEKWLGSFYASGASDSFIASLATSINQLATGDVSSLTSNESMNSLFAAAASRAGLNYGELLTGGVTSSDINILLQGIYEQAISIASSTDNVSKQQLGKQFGLSMQDMIALQNITNEQLQSLVEVQLDYNQMMQKTVYELGNINKRTGAKTQIDNMLDNALARIGSNIATNEAAYVTYSLADMIGDVEINIPYLGPVNLTGALKSGIIGMSVISEVLSMLTSAGSDNFMSSLGSYDSTNVQIGGTGMISGVGNYTGAQGITKSTNTVMYASNQDSSTSQLLSDSIAGNKETVETISSATGANEAIDASERIYDAIVAQTDLIEDLLGATSSDTVVTNIKQVASKMDDIKMAFSGMGLITSESETTSGEENKQTLPSMLEELIIITRRIESYISDSEILSSV